jgi:cell division protein YceG involved in septum cleavage
MSISSRSWSRTVRGVVTVVAALCLLFSLEVFSRFLLEGSVADGPRQMVEVSIPEGASIAQVAQVLHKAKLIEHPLLFRYAVRIMGADTKIQAGERAVAV